MGYACPVCETPQQDAEHLANHLAFTAMLGDEDHETWLDEHAPEWGDLSPEELGSCITGYAPETEFPQLFEDTTDDHEHPRRVEESVPRQRGRQSTGTETAEILAEARAMTREMFDESEDE